MLVNKLNNRWKKVERHKGIYLPTLNKTPIISKSSKVCLMGSCFADEMGWVLAENNVNIGEVDYTPNMRMVSYPWGTFFSPQSIAEMIEISFNGKINEFFDEKTFIKVPSNFEGNHYEKINQVSNDENYKLINLFFKARLETKDYNFAKQIIKKKLDFFKTSILNADVIIITLGLIETWIDKIKKKAWHSFHGDALKRTSVENLAEFRQLNYEDVTKYISKIINLIHEKEKKIIFTVSPIPLNFTFSNKDVVVANKYSKSVLRAAVESFIDDKNFFYFPSFEIVQDCVGWPNSYKEDKRHVKVEIFKDYIAPTFINTFTDFKNFNL
ncbi:GSCFA domain-containing protein [Candidatus Pelagibacter ubique]|jgi:hypothetical protein|nr:GSCFA domain-containing protein [Candidatus Pelagibacter ubique]